MKLNLTINDVERHVPRKLTLHQEMMSAENDIIKVSLSTDISGSSILVNYVETDSEDATWIIPSRKVIEAVVAMETAIKDTDGVNKPASKEEGHKRVNTLEALRSELDYVKALNDALMRLALAAKRFDDIASDETMIPGVAQAIDKLNDLFPGWAGKGQN